jgi:hypothetical protein
MRFANVMLGPIDVFSIHRVLSDGAEVCVNVLPTVLLIRCRHGHTGSKCRASPEGMLLGMTIESVLYPRGGREPVCRPLEGKSLLCLFVSDANETWG